MYSMGCSLKNSDSALSCSSCLVFFIIGSCWIVVFLGILQVGDFDFCDIGHSFERKKTRSESTLVKSISTKISEVKGGF